MALRDLLARIRIQTEGTQEARSELRGIGDAAQEAGREGDEGLGRIGGALDKVRLGAVAAVGAIVGIAKAFIDAGRAGAQFAQDLDLTSSALGLTLGRTRELERGLNRTGQDLSDLRGIVAGLRSAVGEALRGNETYAESLRGIGLEVSSLAGLDTPALLREITQAVLDLDDVSSAEFSFLANLLGDDDAARIVAAAGDIKEALLAELRVSDDEIADALNLGRAVSDAENVVQDAQIGIAADAGGIADSVLAEYARSAGGFFQWLGELGRGSREEREQLSQAHIDAETRAAELSQSAWENAYRGIGRSGSAVVAISQLASGQSRDAWLESVRAIDAAHAELRNRTIAHFEAMAASARQEAREALAAWQAVSLTTPEFDISPAGLRSRGLDPTEINNEQNFLDLVRGFNRQSAFESATGLDSDEGSAAPDPEDQDIYEQGAVL